MTATGAETSASTRGSDLSTLDLWLKLRNSTEQRTYWFLLALSGAALGILAQWKAVYCAGVPAKLVLAALGVAAVLTGVIMTAGNLFDSCRLNALTQGPAGISPQCQEAFRVYRLKGVAIAPFASGLVFAALIAGLVWQLTPDPKQDPVCIRQAVSAVEAAMLMVVTAF